ncbi:MAG: PilZ domain-containing protein, partial [Rhodoferax sp.]|nr:PilZ domain-containing protein [Rhodoferax sp.]
SDCFYLATPSSKDLTMNTFAADGQRIFSRVPFSAPVTLHLAQQTLDVTLLDIALKGALVRTATPMPLQLQQPCRLLLPLTDDGEGIEMAGRIVHLEDSNVGMKCEDIDLPSLTQLRRLLELNTGDADLMDRELSLLFAKRPA